MIPVDTSRDDGTSFLHNRLVLAFPKIIRSICEKNNSLASVATEETGTPPVHLVFYTYWENINMSLFEELRSCGADLGQLNRDGRSLLHIAADQISRNSHYEEISEASYTPLTDLIKRLIDLEVDPEALDNEGRSPLSYLEAGRYGIPDAIHESFRRRETQVRQEAPEADGQSLSLIHI